MQTRVKRKRETWAGVTMIVIGLVVIAESMTYTIGTGARMGPGYFPLLLGGLLALLGVIISFSSDPEEDEKLDQVLDMPEAADLDHQHEKPVTKQADRLRGMGAIVLGILAFMLFGRFGGLVPATFALVFISAMGDINNKVKSALILAAVITVMGVGIFHYGLQLQFPLFRWG